MQDEILAKWIDKPHATVVVAQISRWSEKGGVSERIYQDVVVKKVNTRYIQIEQLGHLQVVLRVYDVIRIEDFAPDGFRVPDK